jgi:3-oxoacyl-[acyl-carrier-protein] synthase-3
VTAHHLEAEKRDPFLGSVERRVADEGMTAVDAEVAAAKMALDDAGLRAEQLDAVISYSLVPDQISPGSAGAVAHALGVTSAMTWAMDAACATGIAQLTTAVALVESGAAKHVLLTQSHLLLRVMQMLHPATPGLGDAATAFVVSRERRWPVLATHCRTSGEFHRAVTWVRGNSPETDHPWWQAGGEYRMGSRALKGARRLMRDTVSIGTQTLREVCDAAQVDIERVDLLASVQPRGWIPGAIAEHAGLPGRVAVTTYEQYAHVGACGPFANWHHALTAGHPAQLVALYAQGAGFTRGAALISMDSSS